MTKTVKHPRHDSTELLAVGKTSKIDDPIANIVFVHGLGGHNRSTWEYTEGDESTYWPAWLERDLNSSGPPVGVWSVGYPTEVFRFLFFSVARRDSIPGRAASLGSRLTTDRLTDRPLIFVTHSLGGIMVKQILRRASDARHIKSNKLMKLALGTRMVLFLSTPHSGSQVAKLAKVVPWAVSVVGDAAEGLVGHLPMAWGLRAVAKFAVKRGPLTAALEVGDPYLSDLSEWYRDNAAFLGIQTVVFYETEPTKGLFVVDRESASQGLSDAQVSGLDANHISISKPKENSDHYAELAQTIRGPLTELPIFRETHLAVHDVGRRFQSLTDLHPDIRSLSVKRVVHPVEKSLGRTDGLEFHESAASDRAFTVSDWQEPLAADSPYDLDRVLLSVWRQYHPGTPIDVLTQTVRHEAERLPAPPSDNRRVSLMPLYYASEALERELQWSAGPQPAPRLVADLESALKRVQDLAKAPRAEIDTNGKTRGLLRKLIDQIAAGRV